MDVQPEVHASDFLALMSEYLAGRIEAGDYQSRYFALMKRRTDLTNNEFQILQMAYGDADDYDPIVRLEHTIEEPELKRRVARSFRDLTELGHGREPGDSRSELH